MTGIRQRAGFTLTEVLVAVVITALCLAGIYTVGTQCLQQIWSAREMSRAAQVFDYEIENLRTTAWTNIQAYGSSYTMSSSSNPAMDLLNEVSGTVQLSPVSGNADLLQATIALSWSGRTAARTETTAIIISRNGFLR